MDTLAATLTYAQGMRVMALLSATGCQRVIVVVAANAPPSLCPSEAAPQLYDVYAPAHALPLARAAAGQVARAEMVGARIPRLDDYSGGHMPIDADGILLALSPAMGE